MNSTSFLTQCLDALLEASQSPPVRPEDVGLPLKATDSEEPQLAVGVVVDSVSPLPDVETSGVDVVAVAGGSHGKAAEGEKKHGKPHPRPFGGKSNTLLLRRGQDSRNADMESRHRLRELASSGVRGS